MIVIDFDKLIYGWIKLGNSYWFNLWDKVLL